MRVGKQGKHLSLNVFQKEQKIFLANTDLNRNLTVAAVPGGLLQLHAQLLKSNGASQRALFSRLEPNNLQTKPTEVLACSPLIMPWCCFYFKRLLATDSGSTRVWAKL